MGGCCAPGCRNATVVGSRGLRMFKLPKCPKRRKEWVEKINRGADWIPPKHAYLCEAHFEESMYLRRIFDGWMRLKTTAVPTIFQHNGRQHRKEGTPCFPKETAILPDEGLTLRKKITPRKTKTPPSRTRKPRLNKRSRAAHAGWARRRANQQSFEASCSTAAYSKSLSTGSVFDAAIEELQDTSHEKNNGACRNFTKSILKPVEARPQTFATKAPPGSNASLRSLLRSRKDGDAATQARPQTFATKVLPGSNASLRSLLRFRKDGDAATQARLQTFATKVPPSSNASLRSLLRFRKGGDAAMQTFATKVLPGSNASLRSLLHFRNEEDAATQTNLPSTMRDKATATLLSLRDAGTDPMDV